MKSGDLVMIHGVGLQRHCSHDGMLALVHEKINDIVIVAEIPAMWEVYCFQLNKKIIFFEDELTLLSSKEE